MSTMAGRQAGLGEAQARRAFRARRGFTLVEMLVVMAISVLLLGLIFGPMVSSFHLVNRGEQMAQAQETARRVMEQVTRELSDAVSIAVSPGDVLPVHFPDSRGNRLPVRCPGYISALDHTGNGLSGSKVPLPMQGALVDFILAEPPTAGAVQPNRNPDWGPVIVRYFLGLRRPDEPRWLNPNEIEELDAPFDNPYLLYRVEFQAFDPHFSNWVRTDPQDSESLLINPDFFYDQSVNPQDEQGRTFARIWREEATALVPTEDVDLVRFEYPQNADLDTPAVRAVPTVTFFPTRIDAEVASPSEAGQGAPATYRVQHGQWSSLQNDGTRVSNAIAPSVLANVLPRVTIYDSDNGMQVVYDSHNPTAQPTRLFTWDSRAGLLQFALKPPKPLEFVTGSNAAASRNGWLLDPIGALFGNLPKEPGPNGTMVPVAHIIPGTETVSVDGTLYRRSGLIRMDGTFEGEVMVDTPDPYTLSQEGPFTPQADFPQQLPAPGTYVLDLRTGRVIVGYPYPGPANPLQPIPIPNGKRVVVSFLYQTNHPGDVVRVDYLTRSLITVNLGIRTYDRATGRPMQTSLTHRIKIRNTER